MLLSLEEGTVSHVDLFHSLQPSIGPSQTAVLLDSGRPEIVLTEPRLHTCLCGMPLIPMGIWVKVLDCHSIAWRPPQVSSGRIKGWSCRGRKVILLLPFRVLSWDPCNKRQINKEKNPNNFIDMYTICIHGRYPRKTRNSWDGSRVRVKCHINRERGGSVSPLGENTWYFGNVNLSLEE